MDTAAMKAMVRKVMEEGFNARNFAVVDAAFHHDYVRHANPGMPGVNSLAEHQAGLAQYLKDYENPRFEIAHMLADGDWVAVHYAFCGTHIGTVHGIPGTGREVRRETAAFFHFRDGKIAESYFVADTHGQIRQMKGEIPA